MLSKWCSPISDPGHMTSIMPCRPLMRSLQRMSRSINFVFNSRVGFSGTADQTDIYF